MTTVLVPSSAIIESLGDLPSSIRLVEHTRGDVLTADQLSADVIVFGAEQGELVDRFAEFTNLQVVQTLSAGVERLVPSIPDGVLLANAQGAHDIPVAEWCVMVLLAHLHLLPRFLDAQQASRWDHGGNALTSRPEDTPGDDLESKHVLIVGHGSIGRAVEQRLTSFGVSVVGITRHGRDGTFGPEHLLRLIGAVDAVILLTPLTGETRGMIDAEALASMRDHTILVNAGRGPVVDLEALERELRAGRLRAALDVTDPEPLPDGHPLWSAPNLILTPHAAGSSRRWQARAYRVVGDQLRRLADQQPLLNIRNDY